MPQAIINYKSQKTLDALLGISKFFEFSIVDVEKKDRKKKEMHEINGVSFTPGDASINTESMQEIVTRNNFNAKELRKKSMAAQKIICDTDVIIDYWNINNKRHLQTKNILEHEIELSNLAITAISKMEVLIGAVSKYDFNEMNKKICLFEISNITEEITLKAFELIEKYTLSHGLALPDSLIASTCIITNLELFTYNVKDYKFIKGLKLFTPKN